MYWIRQTTVNAGSAQGKTFDWLSRSADKWHFRKTRQLPCQVSPTCPRQESRIAAKSQRKPESRTRPNQKKIALSGVCGLFHCFPPAMRKDADLRTGQPTRFAAISYNSSVFFNRVCLSNAFSPGTGRGNCCSMDATVLDNASRFPGFTTPSGN